MHTGADTASPTLTPSSSDPVGDRAARAVFVAFFGSGVAFASWASRIPQVRDALGLEPGALGLVLLALAVGSVIALPVAGIVVTRLGPARTILAMSVLLAVGLATVAVGHTHGVPPVVAGLFLVGFGNGTWDVAMNVAGADVEQRQGRSIMSRFHAGFSLGTVAGALLGLGPGRPPRRRRPPPHRRRAWSSPWRCRSRVRGFLPAVPHEHAAAQPGAAPPAEGLDRAADAAHRAVRAHHGVHRGHRQRLARRRGHRRLPRRSRPSAR